MRGSVFKRCVKCNARISDRRCHRCGSDQFSWAFVVDVGLTPKGKRQQRARQGFSTKREAERALRELLHKVDVERYVEPNALTLGAFLADEWLPAVRPPNLRPAPWNSYRGELTRHVIPRIGGMRLQKLNAVHLNHLYAELLSAGRKRRAGGLSPRTVRYIHVILSRALGDAVRWGRLDRNPAKLADPPAQNGLRPGGHIRTWSPEELRMFLRHSAEDRLRPAWITLVTTGMRRGELLGLRWLDVDFVAARVSVRQTYVSIDGRAQFSEPKTRRSRRTIDLDNRTLRALDDWRKTQAEEREAWGEAWEDHGLVFTQPNGRPIDPDSFTKLFRRLARQAGLPAIRLHDLRHSHATLLLASGVNPKIASERLGHHSTAFTLDVYSHVVPGMQSQAASRVSHLVLGLGSESTEQDTHQDKDQAGESTEQSDDDYPDDTDSRKM